MAHDPIVDGVTTFSAGQMNPRFQAVWDQITDLLNGVVALLAPAITSFVNAQHDHADAAGGGKITFGAIDASAEAEGEYTVDVDASGNVTLREPSAASGFPVGKIVDWIFDLADLEADTGAFWLACDSKTIGNAASGGTARANADCETLFTRLWNKFTGGSVIGIYDSAGSPVSWGANAAADWAAARRISLPDMRGRGIIGRDNQGGTSANRVTASAADSVLGTGGAETHTLSTPEIPSHTHTIAASFVGVSAGGSNALLQTGSTNTGSTGGDGAHNNMQPYIVVDYYIRYK